MATATFKFVNENFRIEAYNNYFFVRNYDKPQNPTAEGIIKSDRKFNKFVEQLEKAGFDQNTTWSQAMDTVIEVNNTKKNISYSI